MADQSECLSGPICFISTLYRDPWGGSEELWRETALRLRAMGYPVMASVVRWTPMHAKIAGLVDAGVEMHWRPQAYPLWQKVLRKLRRTEADLSALDIKAALLRARPSLVVINDHFAFPPYYFMEACSEAGIPFVTIAHANAEHYWPDDAERDRYSAGMAKARTCFFVSEGNRRLASKQLDLTGAKIDIVRNPFAIEYDRAPDWPQSQTPLQMALVGRIDPSSKGHDLILEAFAAPQWQSRDWRLNFYGQGPVRKAVEALIARLGLGEKVVFHGHKSVSDIWRDNHVLTLPSRAEGLPITIVEAMLASRPVVTTDVAGNAEFLEEGVSGFIAEAPTVGLIGQALERMWEKRDELEVMGRAARQAVQTHMPADPAQVFANTLIAFAREPR